MSQPAVDVWAAWAALPEHLVGEVVGGELHVQPRPAMPHAVAATSITAEVHGPFQGSRGGPGGWWIVTEPDVALGGDVLVPDVAGWRKDHLPTLPRRGPVPLAPDWVCEISSPSTVRFDRQVKDAWYARHGVGWMWVVDPELRQIEVRRNEGGRWLIVEVIDGDLPEARLPPFEVVPMPVSTWWLREPEGEEEGG